jgi:NAD-dependent SIR2 family protein deacetylase
MHDSDLAPCIGRSLLMTRDDRQPTGIERAAQAIDAADALLIAAGAGIGVDSGLPDFRSANGFWRAYPRLATLGISFEEMAQPRWFRDDPAMAWAFYGHRLMLYRRTEPHAGFSSLLEWAASRSGGYFVHTSNVDGQFQRAGFDVERIVECHGSIQHLQCTRPCSQAIWSAADVAFEIDEASFRARGDLPRCPKCGAVARPNILMFGDGEWLSTRTDLAWSRHADWLTATRGKRLTIVEIGAGVHLPAVRHYTERVAERFQAVLIRINPADPHGPRGAIAIAAPALAALQAIAAHLSPDHSRSR